MSFQKHMLESNCKFRVFSVHSGDTLLNIIHACYPINCCLLFQQLSCGLQMKFKLLRNVTPCHQQLLSRRHGITSRKRTGVRTSNVENRCEKIQRRTFLISVSAPHGVGMHVWPRGHRTSRQSKLCRTSTLQCS
jgi:hypothetical protein